MFINQKGNEIKSLDNVVLEDHDIWVIGSTEKGSYEHALVVYVGEKLDKSVALDVTAKDGSVVYNAETKTFAFTSKKDATSDELTFTANDANSVLVYDGGNALYTATVTTTNGDTKWTVTVHNEAATEKETYTVTLKWDTKEIGNSILAGNINGSKLVPSDLKCNADLVAAYTDSNVQSLTGTKDVTLTISEVSKGAKVRMAAFVDTEITAANAPEIIKALEGKTSVTAENATEQTGGVIVVEVMSESGVANYYVWKLSAN